MSKQIERNEAVAVSDDMMNERGDIWLKPGGFYAFVCADPIYHGRLVAMTPTHYFIDQASWVADAGRAHQFAADPSKAVEVEYIGEIAIERPITSIYRVGTQAPLTTK